MKKLLLLFLLLFAGSAEAANYWVDGSNGSDANGCNASASPLTTTAKATIHAGIACLSSADTLSIRTGTYSGLAQINTVPSGGGSFSTATTIKGHTGETVTLVFATTAVYLDNTSYTIWDNLRFQGAGPSVTNDLVFFWNGSHHNRFTNSHFSQSRHAFIDGFSQPSGGFNEIISNTIRTGDYHLQSGSPAIDAGFDVSAVVQLDFDGMTVPVNGIFDIGAMEFNQPPQSPAGGGVISSSVMAVRLHSVMARR